ncbi:hypothetical protein Goshw_029781 [Gossypium schwendimanii]|uniref:Uncharacterized protein n=1 Tax=Gossypium schwendimanii TaxID=34291 RepID=A0A7J9LTM9_GOSSC|nr:hypothetical protein [Gossypium schwendimanii]
MDHSYLKETSIEVYLKSGGTISEDESTKGHGSSNLQTNKSFSRVWSDLLRFDSVGKGKYGVNSCSSSSRFGSVEDGNMEFWMDKSSGGEDNHDLMALVEKNFAEDNCKKKNSKKPPKPPGTSKAPLLDAADQQLVREISKLSLRKRARIK